MSQAARESLALTDRTQRLARWVLVLAWVVGAAGVAVFLLAAVAAVLVLQRSSSVNGSGGLALGGVALILLVSAALLALLARYTQLRSADVRASRAYEAAIAGALADLLRTRDGATPATSSAGAPAASAVGAAVAAVAPRPEGDGTADTPPWRPHSHSAEARAEVAPEPVGQPLVAEPTATPTFPVRSEPVPAASGQAAYTEPAYVQPAPAEPAYSEPAPVPPVPVEPTYSRPAPVPAVPVEPTYVQPAPAEPSYAETASVEPLPVEPAAVEPVVVHEPVVAQTAAVQSAVAMAPETGLPVAGWYPDPAGPGQRWWDGLQWTTATR
jgi:hypothetical protein